MPRVRRPSAGFAISIAGILTLTGCSAPESPVGAPEPLKTTATPTPCVDDPELVAAVDAFMDAAQGGSTRVWGLEGNGHSNNLLEELVRSDVAAMRNPAGEGTILSVAYGSGKAGFRDTVSRAAWLYLDGVIYPMGFVAHATFRLIDDGVPPDVEVAAGFYLRGSVLTDLGIYEIVAYNADTKHEVREFLDRASDLCELPTIWG